MKGRTTVNHCIWGEYGDLEDLAVFSYFKDMQLPLHSHLYLTVHLNPYRSWWRRLVKAVRYVFGERSCYGEFNEIVMTVYDVKDTIRFLQQFLNDIDEMRVNR